MTCRACTFVVAFLAAFSAPALYSQTSIVPPEISEDSEIVLEMDGAVTATLRVTTREGSTLVSLLRNGEVETVVMSEDDCSGLWDYCLRRNASSLGSLRPERAYPDSSSFALSFRIGSETRRFTVQGVDQLQDTRYREIIREILSICARYLTGLEGP